MSSRSSRYCLITGAAGGIGRALVDAFSDSGYSVIASDCCAQPPDLKCAAWVELDLGMFASEGDVSGKIDEILSHLGGNQQLHVLVNNAAVQVLGGVGSLSRADWKKTLNVNVLAPFFLSQSLLPQLKSAAGCVINIGSIHARLTKPNFVAYATSKAALAGLTRAMAVDLGAGIRVNAIEPAAINTEMLRAGFGERRNLYEQLEKCHPAERIGEVYEVAQLALALSDGKLGFLHGACVGLDGGISARLYDPV